MENENIKEKIEKILYQMLDDYDAMHDSNIISIYSEKIINELKENCIKKALMEYAERLQKNDVGRQCGRGGCGYIYKVPAEQIDNIVKGIIE